MDRDEDDRLEPAAAAAAAGSLPLSKLCVIAAAIAALTTLQFGYHSAELNTLQGIISRCDASDNAQPVSERPWSSGLPSCLPMSDALFSFATSSYNIGGLVGSLLAGLCADRFGRKRTLMFNNIVYVLGSLVMALSVQPGMLVAGRLITGVAGGFSLVVAPMYLMEIASTKYRGSFGIGNQLGIVLGIFFAQLAGYFLNTLTGWRVVLGLGVVGGAINGLLFSFCPETPRYLATVYHRVRGHTAKTAMASSEQERHALEQTRHSLQRLRRADDVDSELSTLISQPTAASQEASTATDSPIGSQPNSAALSGQQQQYQQHQQRHVDEIIAHDDNHSLSDGYSQAADTEHSDSPFVQPSKSDDPTSPANGKSRKRTTMRAWDLVTHRQYRKPLFLVVMFMVVQQLSGINTVFYYSTSIINATLPGKGPVITLVIGAFNVLVTVIATYIVGRVGRRPLLLSSVGCMGAALVMLGVSLVAQWSIVAMVSLFAVIATFGVGLGPIPFMLPSELFSGHAVATAASISMVTNWLCNFLVSSLFLVVQKKIGGYVFFIFVVFNVVALVFGWRMLPETKGKSPDEVARQLAE
ncbi:general substrate transporter [Ramicandelaber brevisporus]|nr:general substrate transporter [Ramicandelaber brevisporus]